MYNYSINKVYVTDINSAKRELVQVSFTLFDYLLHKCHSHSCYHSQNPKLEINSSVDNVYTEWNFTLRICSGHNSIVPTKLASSREDVIFCSRDRFERLAFEQMPCMEHEGPLTPQQDTAN